MAKHNHPEIPPDERMMSADELNQHLTRALNEGMAIREELEETAQQEAYLARHDSLTELPNRRLFMEEAAKKASAAERHHYGLVFLNLDLRGLKEINDTLSPTAGHQALRKFGRALAETCRETDLAARVGGDEFFVILEGSDAGPYLARLEEALADPKTWLNGAWPLEYYVGVGTYEPNGAAYSPERIAGKIDQAMEAAETELKSDKERKRGS